MSTFKHDLKALLVKHNVYADPTPENIEKFEGDCVRLIEKERARILSDKQENDGKWSPRIKFKTGKE